MPNHSRKYFWLGLIFVFLIGIFGGAYLVLKSSVSQGELVNSTPEQDGKSSDELLAELLKINQNEADNKDPYIPPENKNLTDGFLRVITNNSGSQNIDPQHIASNDFFVSTILPYLKSNQLNLFPVIPDSALKIIPDSKTAQQKYYKDTNKDIIVFYNVMQTIPKLDSNKINDGTTLATIDNNITKLSSSFENLSKVAIPQKLVTTHKSVLISVFSLQKFLEALTNSATDPLKSILVINEAEQLGEFWKKTLYDYVQLPKNKRK